MRETVAVLLAVVLAMTVACGDEHETGVNEEPGVCLYAYSRGSACSHCGSCSMFSQSCNDPYVDICITYDTCYDCPDGDRQGGGCFREGVLIQCLQECLAPDAPDCP